MPIAVVHDGTLKSDPAECCCLCRMPTRYWNQEMDVPVCPSCAGDHELDELPTKSEWLAKSSIRTRPIGG